MAGALAAQPTPVSVTEPEQITLAGGGALALSADLNGDGYSDLVTFAAGGIELVLSNGQGGFQAPVLLPVGTVSSVAAGDFTGDGIVGLVVSVGEELLLLPGLGGGAFGPGVEIFTSGFAALAVADFNQDGNLDIAAAGDSGQGEEVLLLLGNGKGTFSAGGHWADQDFESLSLLTGDFNGDGYPDLLLIHQQLNYPETIDGVILLADAQGDLTGAGGVQAYPGVAVADVNGDGFADVITPYFTPQSGILVLLGNGDGTFHVGSFHGTLAVIDAVVVADLDADGKADLAALTDEYSLILMKGNGDGTFGVGTDYFAGIGPVEGSLTSLAVLLSPIGTQGFVTSGFISPFSYDDSSVTIVRLLHGTVVSPRLIATEFVPSGMVTADFNGDGQLDLATGAPSGLAVLLGNGDGTFQPLEVQAGFPGYYALAAADLNGDGIPDVMVASPTSPLVLAVFLGNGDGSFTPLGTTLTLTQYANWAGLPDVNGDGIPDVVAASLGVVSPVTVYLGKGDGTFGNPITQPFNLFGPMVFADFNGDGKIDLAASYSGKTYVALGNGNGTFGTPTIVAGMEAPAAAADLNGDGIPDLAGYSQSKTTGQDLLTVVLGNGDGTFGPAKYYALQPEYEIPGSSISVADWNGDGHVDIAAMPAKGSYTQFLLGDGQGNFTLQPNGILLYAQPPAAVGDFNGDGKPDVASAADAIWVLLNNSQ
jgi:hypothetical protein